MEVRQKLTPLKPGGILAFNVAPAHSFYYWGPKEIHAWPGEWTDETLNSEHEKEMIFVATKNGDKSQQA